MHLLERESELAQLATDVAAVQCGEGRLVLLEGPAGIGKTELLIAARSLAEEEDMVVTRARGSEFEAGFAFGVVRQLFDPLLRQRSRRQLDDLLCGPAALAGEMLGVSDGGPKRAGVGLRETLHSLHWLVLNLAERASLVALIDDVHWADRSSARFLSYLAGRLDGVRMLIVAARRVDTRASDDTLAGALRERTTRVVGLRPLTMSAMARLVARDYQREVATEFAEACGKATGGNPFYLRELVRALRADGVDPTASAASHVAGEGPASVARSVLTRIAVLSPDAVSVAQTLALLGGEANVAELAALSSLDADSVLAVVDRLADAEVVVGPDPVAFTHPILRASIYSDVPAGERARTHLRAARLLASSGAPAERVAAHLIAGRPVGDSWAVGVLSAAADDALARGAPESAAAYLTRALAEAPADGHRQKLVARLGQSEYLAFQPGASAHLIEAMDAASTAVDRGDLGLQAAKAMIMRDADRSEAAIDLLDRAIGDLADRDSQLSMRLEAQLLAAAGLKLSTRPLQIARMNGAYHRQLGDGPSDRLLLANLANWTLIEGRVPGRFEELGRLVGPAAAPAELACRAAERAMAGGALLREEGSDSQLFHLPIWTMFIAECFERAQYWLEQALDDARGRGSVLGFGLAEAALAEVAYRRGELLRAEAHARAAADISPEDAAAPLVNILIEQGRLDDADRVLAPFRIPPDADHLLLQPIRAARARLRFARGQVKRRRGRCSGAANGWTHGGPRTRASASGGQSAHLRSTDRAITTGPATWPPRRSRTRSRSASPGRSASRCGPLLWLSRGARASTCCRPQCRNSNAQARGSNMRGR